MATAGACGTVESLDNVPPHVWRGLPNTMSLGPSAVNESRIGVWASKLIPKGKRFGPFVGERKKRSQVTSNVYMWEVYFPARGWMCVDATDPMKGNWLRYINWARSTQEQNLFPLEINRAIYYKVLRPIGPGEELLVWYSGEDSPEITAALREERSSLSKKNSPRAKRARRKLLVRARRAGLGGFRGPKQTGETQPATADMWDTEDGPAEEQQRPSSPGRSQGAEEPATLRTSPDPPQPGVPASSAMTEQDAEEEEEEEEEPGDLPTSQPGAAAEQEESRNQPDPQLSHSIPAQEEDEEEEEEEEEGTGPGAPPPQEDDTKTASSSPARPEPEAEPDLDQDGGGDGGGDAPGGTHPCLHCERHFSTKQGLERHVHIHAAAGQQTHAFRCRYCGKSFGSQVGRRRHERRHENASKKRPGSLAGTAALLIPAATRLDGLDGGGAGGVSSGLYAAAVGAGSPFQIPGAPAQNPEASRKEPTSDGGGDRPFVVDENGESKELHPCKYCKKAFGTHTNMRRHQRRIHERHLLPKGVRRKGMLLQESPAHHQQQQQQEQQQQQQPGQSPGGGGSPPLVYVPSADTEDEADRDDYIVDVSKNISENLSLYIDGKILSASAVSGCDVIELDASSAALFGLDAVIIGPAQISQALKVDGGSGGAVRQVAHGGGGVIAGRSASKRRTSTPPLVPGLKLETETGSPSSTSSPCSNASSSGLLVGGLFAQSAVDGLAFQKEKTVYLSPKLKQLLQTHDQSQKPTTTTIALIAAERHRQAPPLSVTSLPGGPARFKRRTASPPSSTSLSPAPKGEPAPGSSYALRVPKLEGYGVSAAGWSVSGREEREAASPPGRDPRGWTAPSSSSSSSSTSSSGGNSCNQQPLDLSAPAGRRSEGVARGAPGELVLDLSMHRKGAEPEVKSTSSTTTAAAVVATQPPSRKRKPNTSMLEKVLMNEYAGPTPPAAGDDSSALGSPDESSTPGSATGTYSPGGAAPESAHPSPPSLTPVTLNPPSPGASSLASPTPPPPVLPTVPSPPGGAPGSPLSPPSDCSTLRSLPVLSPKMSPRSVKNGEDDGEPASDAEEEDDAELSSANHSDAEGGGDDAEPPGPAPLAVEDSPLHSPSKPSPSIEPPSPAESGVARRTRNSLLNGKVGADSAAPGESTEPGPPDALSPPAASTAFLSKKAIKEEPAPADVAPPPGGGSDPSPPPPAAERPAAEDEEDENNGDAFAKSFVCNVCAEPFRSIKELSRHIAAHAAAWPYKCEFCVQLFGEAAALLEHRAALHGVGGRIFLCSACSKEFAFLCNLEQHQRDLHPGAACTHVAVETGKLRPQNYTDPGRAREEGAGSVDTPAEPHGVPAPKQEEEEEAEEGGEEPAGVNGEHADEAAGEDPTEELYTTIKIMASEAGKARGPDVRLGINQHYPSFKPPPFPYHNRSHAAAAAAVPSATNFTTHNIPQTFSTAIRCTKCGDGFDNMPELHKHILACANASDKRRYTPKKNPVPLRQIVKAQNGVLSPGAAAVAAATAAAAAGQSAFRRMGQPKRLNFNQEPPGKTRMSSLSRKKNQLVQKAITQRNKSAATARKVPVKAEEVEEEEEVQEEEEEEAQEQQEVHVCPHCSREFTYPASLSKHIAVSCPMKPAAKKAKKGASPASDKNMSLRKRAGEVELQEPEPPPKALGKTRARSSGAVEADAPQAARSKATPAPGRPKRPASFPAAATPPGKKGRKGQVQPSPPTPPSSSTSSSSETPGVDGAARPAGRMGGRALKEAAAPKKGAEPKPPPQQQKHQTQPRREVQGERFSLRARERAGGAVTRSLQMANAAAPPTDDLSSQDPKEPTESLLK